MRESAAVELRLDAQRSRALVANIEAYLTGNPMDDDGWDEMLLRLVAIESELVRILESNGLESPSVGVLQIEDNPYLIP